MVEHGESILRRKSLAKSNWLGEKMLLFSRMFSRKFMSERFTMASITFDSVERWEMGRLFFAADLDYCL